MDISQPMSESDFPSLLRGAFNEYLKKIYEPSLEPGESYFGYEFDFLNGHKWFALGGKMVECELRELTNLMNRWHHMLRRWHAWSEVLGQYDETSAWELQTEFMDSLVGECLYRPSSMRDTFVAVATNAMHQVRLSQEDDYLDYLEGDPTSPDKKPLSLTRKAKEKRLAKLVTKWEEAQEFLSSIASLDDDEYKVKTSDYRNRSNHMIGPRLGVGQVRTVHRTVVSNRRMDIKTNEGFVLPEKMVASYDFGGTEPLNIHTVRLDNLAQFRVARVCYLNYRRLLMHALA